MHDAQKKEKEYFKKSSKPFQPRSLGCEYAERVEVEVTSAVPHIATQKRDIESTFEVARLRHCYAWEMEPEPHIMLCECGLAQHVQGITDVSSEIKDQLPKWRKAIY